MKFNWHLVLSIPAVMLAHPSVFADSSNGKATQLETLSITGSDEDRARATGSLHKIKEESLEKWHYTDVNRVLNEVPGVYLRQEDGYGLRPNIGMRGSDSNRSKKVTLMEDGVLFAPAPYSAPAAYYFPMLSRMKSVEVYKGLSSIKFGPNSVGGALNFVSRDIPVEETPTPQGSLDVSAGSFATKKLHGHIGNASENFGWMFEGVNMQTDGFKELDRGGPTGFNKNDAVLKLRFNSDIDAEKYHQFDVKIGYANESSNETYLGLTDEDFNANPYRRYVLSKDDEMSWDHYQFSLNHFYDPGENYIVNSTIYRRDFSRNWDKMNGFTGNAPLTSEILLNPNTPLHGVYYALMTGEESSSTPHDRVLVEAKKRDFVSQGIQSQVELDYELNEVRNQLTVGLRYHEDQVTRDHSVREFDVVVGDIFERKDIAPRDTLQNHAKAQAVSFFLFNEMELGDLSISGGLRNEIINSQYHDYKTNQKTSLDNSVLLPGIGFNYKMTDTLRVLAGVHEGFVSVPPGSDASVKPEKSVNYELGLRYAANNLSGSLIGFFSDYSNLQGSCTFSLGCASEDIGKGFNAGKVDIWGLEADMRTQFSNVFGSKMDMPVSLVYTFTDSRFKNEFSSPRPDLIDVKVGDKLPMLPEHLLTLIAGLKSTDWEAALSFNYVDEMRTTAGQDAPIKTNRTDAQHIFDFSFNYFVDKDKTLYATIDNVLDEAAIVARRPFGARPGKPRSFMVGFKMDY